MNAKNLTPLHKQLGNKIVEFKNNKVYGYNIVSYNGYEPDTIELVGVVDNPVDGVMSADTAYDLLFGAPKAPDFTKVLSNI